MQRIAIKATGFTLVEVLVISPVVILFIGAFIGLLVTLTGESLVIREKNVAAYDTQAALDEVETSVTQATGFLTNTNGIAISSPQGKNNTAAAFTNTNGAGQPETLIVKSAATTKISTDPTRSLIYMGTGACDSKNPVYEYLTVYFVALDGETLNDTTDKSLYKRTILPQYAACAAPYQKGSCEATMIASNSAVCKVSDEKLVSNVTGFDVSYFIGSNTTPAADTDANSATDVAVNMSLSKQVAGNSVTSGGTSRTNSQNIQSSNGVAGSVGIGGGATPPSNPAVTWSRNTTDPYKTYVSWGMIGNATSYNVKYRIGGGAEQTKTINQPGTTAPTITTDIDASHRKQTVQLTDITVNTTSGSFSYGSMPAISSLPNWNECTFQNGWHNYKDWYGGNTFTTGGFTKTSSKLVGLKGLVRGGAVGSTICQLPVGFRPKFAGEKLIFQVTTSNGGNWGRVDVEADGRIVLVQGGNDWVSLDGIIFAADDSTYTWTNRIWEYGWSNYGSGHSTLRSTTDNQGRVHIQGLGSYPGTSPNGNVMTNVGTGPSHTLHVPAMSGGPGIVQVNTSGWVLVRSSPNSYQQIQLMYRPGGATGWQNMPFSSGWTNYNNGWPTMQCHRGSDDVVIVQGLIAHPGGGNGAYIGDTGPCGRFSSGQGIGQADRLLLSPWMSNETTGRIDMINGVSLLSQGTQDPWTALDGIHFIAD